MLAAAAGASAAAPGAGRDGGRQGAGSAPPVLRAAPDPPGPRDSLAPADSAAARGAATDSLAAAPSIRAGASAPTARDSTRTGAASNAPAARDSAGAGTAAAARDSARARPKLFDQPRWVMARSLVLPGWGQLHNRAWLKAAAVAGSETYLILNIVRDESDLRALSAEVDAARQAGDLDAERSAVDRYNARLDRVVGREWLLAGLVTYALVDAYVDAHFVKFKFEFEHDPALPGGPPKARIVLETRF